MHTRLKRLRNKEERGAALVEFAIAVPIFIALLALILDAGLGYSASRSSSSAARSAARVGALAGEARDADFRILDALVSQYGDGDQVDRVVVYLTGASAASGGSEPGGVPDACTNSVPGLCNVYFGSDLNNLQAADYEAVELAPDGTTIVGCDPNAPDAAWCPLDRRDDDGSYLGVYIETKSEATIGIGASEFSHKDRSVFALYFPPLPTEATP